MVPNISQPVCGLSNQLLGTEYSEAIQRKEEPFTYLSFFFCEKSFLKFLIFLDFLKVAAILKNFIHSY